MPITLDLADDGNLLNLKLVAPWDLSDLRHIFDVAQKLLDNSPHRLDCIADVTIMGRIPEGMLWARQSPFLSHPKSGYQVIVGADTYAKTMADTRFRLTNYKRVRFFTTIEEARAFLEAVREPVAGYGS